ncbi:MAG: 3-phosphoshikimate 1-carboxyvinyltransferase [Planctomycetota bacterium]
MPEPSPLQDPLPVLPVREPVVGAIRPPGSKSITNRALLCAALADGESTLSGALKSDDTHAMVDGLSRLGFDVASTGEAGLRVGGRGGRTPAAEADLFVGNSGTTVRFLTAMLALARGRYRLDGIARMRQRPIGDLADALNRLGGAVRCESEGGCPPVVVEASGLRGGEAPIRGDASSQFLSGLLMAAPFAESPVTLSVQGELVSKPYVTITLKVMEAFGVAVDAAEDLSRFTIAPACYTARHYEIEPDASAASYFWAAAAITGGRVRVEGLTAEALQGDVGFVELLALMGCEVQHDATSITVTGGKLRGVTVDMNAVSDTAQTLAAVALFAEGPTRITGIAHNRLKETDRIEDLATELRRAGAQVETHEDGLTIHPGPLRAVDFETYDDHRMAMSLALVGLRHPGVRIKDPSCTAKTYPDYFADLDRLVASARK